MEAPKMLTGEELVSRGVTTIFATLPEIGLKDVTPNGSWLEIKQIQAALEARKKLIDVERIEKFGTLSQAEWRDDLRLAEVTKHTGSHWQYFGHNIGKKLYLRSEEALFLMEVNCLQLKHNEVTVSLQKAYSLLLDDSFTIDQYKVYASLSRLGYKVYRHKGVKETICSDSNTETKVRVLKREVDSIYENLASSSDTVEEKNDNNSNSEKVKQNNVIDIEDNPNNIKEGECSIETETNKNNEGNEVSSTITDESLDDAHKNNAQSNVQFQNNNSGEQNAEETNAVEKMDISQGVDSINVTNITDPNTANSNISHSKMKIEKLQSRRLRPAKDIHKVFEEIPEMANQAFAYINIPEDYYIPKNIFVNKTTYKLNLERVKGNKSGSSSDEASYSSSEDENSSTRSIRNTPINAPPQNELPQIRNFASYYSQMRLPRINQQFQPFFFWRPRPRFNLMNFNSFYPRPFVQHQFHHRFPFNIRPNPFLRPFANDNILDANSSHDNPNRLSHKRAKKSKKNHLRAVKMLAAKVKAFIMSGNMTQGHSQLQAVQALHRLLYTYNTKYKTNLRLNSRFDLINEANVVQTIELDDEEVKRKKPKLGNDAFNENLNKLRQLALKLKNLENKGIATSRHRRAFSNAVKMFKTSYNADVYLNNNYEIIDRRHITLDSSSDSECVAAKSNANQNNIGNKKIRKTKKKKLRNPFYILKRLSEQHNEGDPNVPSTSKTNAIDVDKKDIKFGEIITKPIIFSSWLPKDDDFGRAELCSKNTCMLRTIDRCEEGLLIDFVKSHSEKYDSWIDVKIAFMKYAYEIHKQYLTQGDSLISDNLSGLRPIVRPEDCSDMPTILEKLRIIKTSKENKTECNIKIHLDVYHRDVPNFRKTNPPKPHFRIVCFDDSSKLPSGEEVASLNAKYNDSVDIVYAIVGVGSISYLQINPIDIPIYIPNNDRP